MGMISRITLSLAGFLLIASGVYGFTSHEVAGAALLFVGAATFCYLGLVARNAAKGGWPGDDEDAEPADEEVEVAAPTIWPLGFAVSGLLLALGLIVNRWVLVVGVLAFAASAAGWLREVSKAHRAASHA
jgi:hypothetical protein